MLKPMRSCALTMLYHLSTNHWMRQMARKLHDRLALASYKAQNDLENMSFTLVEAHVASSYKRRRPSPSTATSSDTSSSTSETRLFSSNLASSPTTAPLFSDDTYPSGRSKRRSKRAQLESFSMQTGARQNLHKRARTQSMAPPLKLSRSSWKAVNGLPESSPGYRQKSSHFSTSHGPNLSFVSETPTIPDSPTFREIEHHDRSRHSYSANSSKFHSSPPRTPPPSRSRITRNRISNAAGEEGADLLMYLATSPSPAHLGAKSRIHAPSTPPSHTQALPSSMMSTPGGGGFMAGFNTPGQNFNFADFVNVTPSPAQGAFGSRTPGPTKTPLAAREARRRLNFESLLPPGASPNLSNSGRVPAGKEAGLGMELGGELVS